MPGSLEAPHDMVLLPAPLDVTGSGGDRNWHPHAWLRSSRPAANPHPPRMPCLHTPQWREACACPAVCNPVWPAGERLLSILVSETKEGANMHKFVLAEPAADASSAQQGGAAGSGGGEDEESIAIAAAKAGAAAHFGGPTHKHKPDAGVEEAAVGDEEARVGHSMVKPVDGAEQQQQQRQGEEAQPAGSGEGPGGDGAQPGGQQAAAAGGEATHIGHSMVKPVGEQEQAEQQQQLGDSSDADFLADEDKQQQQQQSGEAEAAHRAHSLTHGRTDERHGLARSGKLGRMVLACRLQCGGRPHPARRPRPVASDPDGATVGVHCAGTYGSAGRRCCPPGPAAR